MKILAIWISILLSLFMFQSIWNMAAAFCVHQTAELSHPSHFGHHSSNNCPQVLQLQQTVASEHSDISNTDLEIQANIQFLFDDHQDHAPSFAHYLMVAAPQNLEPQALLLQHSTQRFYWQNLYQSPALKRPVPPPTAQRWL